MNQLAAVYIYIDLIVWVGVLLKTTNQNDSKQHSQSLVVGRDLTVKKFMFKSQLCLVTGQQTSPFP